MVCPVVQAVRELVRAMVLGMEEAELVVQRGRPHWSRITCCVLHRRVYSVESPNTLWHLDGYHKLIRWKIGGIDGYSRLITYLKCSTNNYASTVLSAFMDAVEKYGLPSHTRLDRGGENVFVSQFMLDHPDRGPDS